MDKTKSAFGKRMFKKWLLEPLRDAERINERLDAVEDLMFNDEFCEVAQNKISKLGDLERLIHSIYNFGSRSIFHFLDFDAYIKPKNPYICGSFTTTEGGLIMCLLVFRKSLAKVKVRG